MPHTFKLRKNDRLLGYGLLPTAGAVVFALVAAAVLVGSYRHRSNTELSVVVRQIDDRTMAIDEAFLALDTIKDRPCSIGFIQAVQKVIVTSQIVQDIIYHADSDLCGGAYGQPQTLYDRLSQNGNESFYVLSDGSEIQRNIRFRFAPNSTFTLYTRGARTLVLRALTLNHRLQHDHAARVEVVAFSMTGPRLIDGDNLPREPAKLSSSIGRVRADGFRTEVCTRDGNYCAVSTTSLGNLVLALLPLLAFSTLSGGVLGYVAGTVFLAWRSDRLAMPAQLRKALKDNRLTVLYQPIVDAGTGRVVAAEALIRWTVSNGRSISPDVFVPVAEAAGLAGSITCAVIRLVGQELAGLMAARRDFKVSINIVPTDLESADFFDAIEGSLIGRGVLPEQIAFEITERQEVKVGPVTDRMSELRRMGYQFYVDDFGTGYSSLAYLGDLPIDAIKLDRSFTMAVGTDYARARLVPPMLEMARELSIAVVVEGVETVAQAEYFRQRQATRFQGWLYSKALPAAELAEFLDAR